LSLPLSSILLPRMSESPSGLSHLCSFFLSM
jgi:hypothetical protein